MNYSPSPGESPGRELTKIRKKKIWKGLILKDEMGDCSSFHCV
jgi:hypothetical protein